MEKIKFSRLAKLIIYIVSKLSHNITRTKLVKLLYLIDLKACQETKTPLTDLVYVSYYYGPYSPKIIEAITSLNNFEIQEDTGMSFGGNPFYSYSIGTNPRIDLKQDELLKSDEKKLVDCILDEYGTMPLDNLLKIVYDTKEYKKTPLGKDISFT